MASTDSITLSLRFITIYHFSCVNSCNYDIVLISKIFKLLCPMRLLLPRMFNYSGETINIPTSTTCCHSRLRLDRRSHLNNLWLSSTKRVGALFGALGIIGGLRQINLKWKDLSVIFILLQILLTCGTNITRIMKFILHHDKRLAAFIRQGIQSGFHIGHNPNLPLTSSGRKSHFSVPQP
jgi:hypothetical protein